MAIFEKGGGARSDPAGRRTAGFPPLAGSVVETPTLSVRAMFAAGVFGPPLFVATVAVGGFLVPGYSQLASPVSDLTESGALLADPLGALLVLSGLLNALTGYGLVLRYAGRNRLVTTAGLLIVGYGAIAMLLASLFPQDPGGPPVTATGMAHIVLVAVSALLLVAAILLAGQGFRARPGFRAWSFGAVALMLAGGASVPVIAAADLPLLGLAERVTQLSYLAWLFVTALAEARRADGTQQVPQPAR